MFSQGQVHVRKAEPRDLDAIAALWEELLALHHSLDRRFWIRAEDGARRFRDWMEESLGKADRVLLVADLQQKVVGFLHGVLKTPPPPIAPKLSGLITDLVVSEGRRGQGIGAELVKAAEQYFMRQGATEVILTVALHNRDGKRFWDSMGFEPRTVTMWKPLG